MNLHAALKLEFEKAQKTYTNGVTKLEALSLVNKDNKGDKHGVGKGATVSGKVAPIAQSHQRQLSLKACEIQGRDSMHFKSIKKSSRKLSRTLSQNFTKRSQETLYDQKFNHISFSNTFL